MRAKLGDSYGQEPFKFKIGDKVLLKFDHRVGVVVEGDCFTAAEPYSIFYRVRLLDASVLRVTQDEIEPE